MIINKSTVDLAAQHAASSQTETSETLRAWIGEQRPDFEAMDRGTTASISSAALAALKANLPAPAANAAPSSGGEVQAIEDAIAQADDDPVLHLIRLMVEMLTGHKIGSVSAKAARAAPAVAPTVSGAAPPRTNVTNPASAGTPRAGYGVEYDKHVVHSESEQTRVQARGTVVTADGREIGFKLDLAMTRSYREESSVSLRQGDGVKKDPLVINFGSDAVNLQSQRFSFQLDGSGGKEQVPMLASGSGFLSLDLNGNGLIDSGMELFGAKSGNGFAQLGQYDSDNNGWIDESDAVFSKLRIWTPDANGQGRLATLKEMNVGALSLTQTATPFELKDGANRSLGSVRSTSVFLREDGGVGSLQQVDLTV